MPNRHKKPISDLTLSPRIRSDGPRTEYSETLLAPLEVLMGDPQTLCCCDEPIRRTPGAPGGTAGAAERIGAFDLEDAPRATRGASASRSEGPAYLR